MEIKVKYHPKKYLEMVERMNDLVLDRYMKDEFDFILNIVSKNKYHVFDLGAGYGRVISRIIRYVESVTAIELDNDMYNQLEVNERYVDNVHCIKGDITGLSSYISLPNPYNNLFLLCQNTLGVIEGDYKKMLEEISRIGLYCNAEVIISVFNAEALTGYGVSLYSKISDMVGDIDLSESCLSEGVFVSNTGYLSKWWSKVEINEMLKYMNAKIVALKETYEYSIYHIKIL